MDECEFMISFPRLCNTCNYVNVPPFGGVWWERTDCPTGVEAAPRAATWLPNPPGPWTPSADQLPVAQQLLHCRELARSALPWIMSLGKNIAGMKFYYGDGLSDYAIMASFQEVNLWQGLCKGVLNIIRTYLEYLKYKVPKQSHELIKIMVVNACHIHERHLTFKDYELRMALSTRKWKSFILLNWNKT